jgi:hypothetical protein
MAENKTKPTKVSVAAFLAKLPDQTKRADAQVLVKMMQRATGEKPVMWGPSIIGFGRVHYVYESGREGDMCLVGFSPRKSAVVLYILTGLRDEKSLLAKLGKHATGKVCLYIKKLADVDPKVLDEMIVKCVASRRAEYPR